jgi:hypothetical protein
MTKTKNIRKPCSEETKLKISLAKKGKTFSKEHKDKLSESHKKSRPHMVGFKHTDESKHKMRMVKLGKIMSEETKNKISNKLKGIIRDENYYDYLKGDKSHLWKGGITSFNDVIRKSTKMKKWIKKILIRDDYTCQICFKIGGNLEVHHIKSFSEYPELRFIINNGITLCKSCHIKTDNYGIKTNKKQR